MAPAARDFRKLRLDELGRSFGAVTALEGLSLEIDRGEFVALLGPSGCGKSTALNCIAGLLATTRGAIYIDDRRIDVLAPEERGFGMVFQNYALFPHMSVRGNVGFGLRMRHRRGAEAARRIEEALATVRLQGFGDRLPGQLSGGQQQRVAIARAIAIDPPLVLMDEPLSNLDAKLRLEMRREIRRIHAGLGSITIYVTHDQEEALSLADRIVVLREGRIRQVGTPEELYSQPATLDVAEFMGFRNRVPCRILKRDGKALLVEIAGSEFGATAQTDVRGDTAIAVLRPDDLVVRDDATGGLAAVVAACEYRGHCFFCEAKSLAGIDLLFRSERRMQAGEQVRLVAAAERILVFPEEGA